VCARGKCSEAVGEIFLLRSCWGGGTLPSGHDPARREWMNADARRLTRLPLPLFCAHCKA
jgi:hypothetical protein